MSLCSFVSQNRPPVQSSFQPRLRNRRADRKCPPCDPSSGSRSGSRQVCSSPCFLKSLQMKPGPRAKVQQPGTFDQSAHKKTALMAVSGPPGAPGPPSGSLTSLHLLLDCFSGSSELVLIRLRGNVSPTSGDMSHVHVAILGSRRRPLSGRRMTTTEGSYRGVTGRTALKCLSCLWPISTLILVVSHKPSRRVGALRSARTAAAMLDRRHFLPQSQ